MSSLQWTNFVSASCSDESFCAKNDRCHHLSAKLNGNEVKKFYEDVVSSTSDKGNQLISPVKKRETFRRSKTLPTNRGSDLNCKTTETKFSLNQFFKAAQENNVVDLKMCLQHGCNVNEQDSFGWTALMCAVCNGSVECAKVLIAAGADLSLRDKRGRSVWNIAKRQSNKQLLDLLHQGANNAEEANTTLSEPLQTQSFYCDLCKMTVQSSKHDRHETSTVHLLNCERKRPPTVYFLPENNVGFRLMVKAGWNKDGGLGPDGTGLKYPIKTVLKKDRKGIGSKTSAKARITHFKPCDTAAVADSESSKGFIKRRTKFCKKLKTQMERREKKKEIEFRRMFH